LTPAEFSRILSGYSRSEKQKWYRFGMLAAVVANCHRGEKTKPFKPEDFMPVPEKKKVRQAWEDQLEQVKMLNVAFGGDENPG